MTALIAVTFKDLTPDQAVKIIGYASASGVTAAVSAPAAAAAPAAPPPPVAAAPAGLPPPPVAAAPAAPPPPPAAPAPAADTPQGEVVRLMQLYVRAVNPATGQPHGANGAKKVLAQIGAAKVQDVTDPAQLKWLKDAFANTAWAPA